MTRAAGAIAADLDGCVATRTVLFGHSLGAWLALETARAMADRNASDLSLLVVSGANAPSSPKTGISKLSDDQLWETFLEMNGQVYGQRLLPARSIILRALRADFEMVEQYVPRHDHPLKSPMIVYAGTADSGVDAKGVDGWGMHSRAEVQVRWFRGGHLFVRDEAASVVEQLTVDIRRELGVSL